MNVAATTTYPRALSRPTSLSRAGYLFLAVFLLVVFEGAVRKWVSSSQSVSLLLVLVRDLLAFILIIQAWKGGHFKKEKKIAAIMFAWSCLVLLWGLVQLVGGESSPIVLIIGMRFWLLYTWFAVAAACTMNEADYRAAIMVAAIIMLILAPLALVQHYSPPGARINMQLDGNEDDVFVVVAGVVRTTGTFSFTTGFANFMTLVAPIVFGLLGAKKRTTFQYLLALAVFLAFGIGAVMSGSRTAVISSGAMFGAYLVGRLLFSKMRNKPAAAVAVVVALAFTALLAYFFQDAIDVTQTRFEQASAAEDFGGRVFTVLFGESIAYNLMTWLGYGIGFGSNLATFFRTGGAFFALAESEGGRIVLEGGLVGVVFLALKAIALGLGIAKSVRISARTNSPFPLLVWLTTAIALLTWSSIGQLTANGLLGVMLTFALLLFRYPRLEIFPPRTSRQ
ncbi:Lipid A core - O-antigen ligase [Variovorax sp. SRS16]|uniref:hypothetical protein n=1 Tax=Variovorax sp. SRS16 TaxID=282217 RepID=UPI0013174191|nr:hypothetical protein [Variovorax sp. SRS16]VTU27429.1 Lipid A core - O-antigen ligase [Variovorax sp. SRS16]